LKYRGYTDDEIRTALQTASDGGPDGFDGFAKDQDSLRVVYHDPREQEVRERLMKLLNQRKGDDSLREDGLDAGDEPISALNSANISTLDQSDHTSTRHSRDAKETQQRTTRRSSRRLGFWRDKAFLELFWDIIILSHTYFISSIFNTFVFLATILKEFENRHNAVYATGK
jgi:hypothetical protein